VGRLDNDVGDGEGDEVSRAECVHYLKNLGPLLEEVSGESSWSKVDAHSRSYSTWTEEAEVGQNGQGKLQKGRMEGQETWRIVRLDCP
jgi:hypothetical protein